MPAPEHILNKIKLLRNLQNSPNASEADNARQAVEGLIVKYNITQEDLKSIEEAKPLYGEDDLLFHTVGLQGWKGQLALSIAKHLDCFIIQEELVPAEGSREYKYYVYGDKANVNSVRYAYLVLEKKVDELVKFMCRGRGQIYIDSYCEGVVQAIKETIIFEGIQIPRNIKIVKEDNEAKALNNGDSNLSTVKEDKAKPIAESVDINSQSLIKDIAAYFKGVNDGSHISLSDMWELDFVDDDLKQIKD